MLNKILVGTFLVTGSLVFLSSAHAMEPETKPVDVARKVRFGQVYFKEAQMIGILSLSMKENGQAEVEKWICVAEDQNPSWKKLGVNNFDWVEFVLWGDFPVITKRFAGKDKALIRPFVGTVVSSNNAETVVRISSDEQLLTITNNTKSTQFQLGDLVSFSYPKTLSSENIQLLERGNKNIFGECPICLENKDLYSICDCEHLICHECTHQYLLAVYKDLTKYPLKCSMAKCPNHIKLNEAEKYLTEQEFRDLESFYCFSALPEKNRSKCPSCSYLMFYSNADPNGRCHQCNLEYCGRCSNTWDAHKGRTCEELRNQADLLAMAEQHGWKNCPQCNIFIEKAKGCNHMQHQNCSQAYSANGVTHFCYCCGTLLINARQTVDRQNHFPNGLFRDCVIKKQSQQ